MPTKTRTRRPKMDPAHSTATLVASTLREMACEGGVTTRKLFEQDPLHMRLLTRAGWANVHVEPQGKYESVWMYVQFDTPCLARALGLDSNVNTGKWNHHGIPMDPERAVAQVRGLFERLIPRGEHAVAEAEFFGAVADMLERAWHQAMDRWYSMSDEERERVNRRRRVPVMRSCGALSTDNATMHVGCAACGTDYSGQDAREFLTTAGRFLLG